MIFPVDLQYFSGEKTEKATPRKKQDARQKGQVAKSSDLSPAFAITSIFMLLYMFGASMLDSFTRILRETLTTYMLWDVNQENLGVIMSKIGFEAIKIVGPIFGISIVVALAVNYMQVGIIFTAEPLTMKLDKINPIQGAKRIFSLRTIVELLKSILKISVGVYVAYSILWSAKDTLIKLSLTSVESVLSFTGGEVVKLGLFIGVLFLILAVSDYWYQRFEYEKSLRMSKQDIKDEYKKTEGDPLIKSKIKQRQRQMWSLQTRLTFPSRSNMKQVP
jgi:flagellar biosynthetic protein FlhB